MKTTWLICWILPWGFTVTVAVAVAFAEAPVAVAVYVVVDAGVTVWVPPVAERL
jgi:hypothetical protein